MHGGEFIAIGFTVLVMLVVLFAGIVLGIVALVKLSRLGRDLKLFERELFDLGSRVMQLRAAFDRMSREGVPAAPPGPVPEPGPVAAAVETPAPPPAPGPVASAPETTAAPAPAAEAPQPAPAPSPPPIQAFRSPPGQAPPAPPPPGRSFEELIGRRWMTWVGVIVLFLSAGFFVKYAMDNEWIGPTARVALGSLFGVALLAVGQRLVARSMRALGQGLMGGGLAILYVSLYAAFALYGLLSQATAFGTMVAVTVAGMTLAVVHDAPAVSVLALIGGFLTPLMVSTGQDSRDVLFTYVLLLDLGVLGVTYFRGWRGIDPMAFVGTAILFAGWAAEFYDVSDLGPTLAWVSAFFLVFLAAPFINHLRLRTSITVERFILALFNAGVAFWAYWALLHQDHRPGLGFVALGMSAVYLGFGIAVKRRLAIDAKSLFGFIGLSVVFLTLAIPLHLSLEGITMAWAFEAPILVFLGYRFEYRPVRIGGFVVLWLAVARLFAVHWPLHEEFFTPILNVRFASALCLPAAAAATALVHHLRREAATPADRILGSAAAIASGFLLLTVLSAELVLALDVRNEDELAMCAGTLVWAAGASLFMGLGLRWDWLPARIAGLVTLAVAGVFALGIPRLGEVSPISPRFGTRLLAVATAFGIARSMLLRVDVCGVAERVVARILHGIGVFILFITVSVKTWTYARQQFPGDSETAGLMSQMCLSIVWAVFAIAMLIAGFWKQVRPLRFAALGLFYLTAAKVVLLDMASLREIYRIVSFLVLGLLMVGASYLYYRLEKRLRQPE